MGLGMSDDSLSHTARSTIARPHSAAASSSQTRSKSGKGTRAEPIDLCGSSPPCKRRSVKRKSTDDAESEGVDTPAKKKVKSEEEEKRLKRFRTQAPATYNEIRQRALTQRMFVVDRQRSPPKQDPGSLFAHPIETVSMAGTTGNIYHIVIDKVPSCDCPHAMKGNQCKHVVYVLNRVLRVPANLEYQSAFLSTELVEIFEKAPHLPSETADESAKDGKRKPIEGECPICVMDFEPDNDEEAIVYCKASCGNNIHKSCFDQWAKTKQGGPITCPFCRSRWEVNDADALKHVASGGTINAEGYVNVASQLGLSGERDYSTYNRYWVRRQGYGDYWD